MPNLQETTQHNSFIISLIFSLLLTWLKTSELAEIVNHKFPSLFCSGTLYALAKQSKNLGAFKLARFAYDKLQATRVPVRFQEAVDLGSIMIRSKPFLDGEV